MHFSIPRRGLSVLAAFVLAFTPFAPGAMAAPSTGRGGHATRSTHPAATPAGDVPLRQAMRKLWEDHVAWTRLVIVSTVANLPDLEATTNRLLQNQTEIGNAVKPFYGDAAGEKLTRLLRAHIVGAAQLLAAAKAGDAAGLDAAKAAWYANGDEIAGFLSRANPSNWPEAEMRSMMRQHLDLTLSEAVDQLHGSYPESVADYDKIQDEILRMADMLSDGLARQFPQKL